MVIIGLILVLVALAIGAALLLGTSGPEASAQEVDISLLDSVTITFDPLTLVVGGMVSMFLLWLGLVLIKTTLARKARARKQRKRDEAAARERLNERDGYYDDRGFGMAPPSDAGRGRPELAEEDPRLAEQRQPRGEETTRIPQQDTGARAARPPREDEATGRIQPVDDPDATRQVPTDDATQRIRQEDDPRA